MNPWLNQIMTWCFGSRPVTAPLQMSGLLYLNNGSAPRFYFNDKIELKLIAFIKPATWPLNAVVLVEINWIFDKEDTKEFSFGQSTLTAVAARCWQLFACWSQFYNVDALSLSCNSSVDKIYLSKGGAWSAGGRLKTPRIQADAAVVPKTFYSC